MQGFPTFFPILDRYIGPMRVSSKAQGSGYRQEIYPTPVYYEGLGYSSQNLLVRFGGKEEPPHTIAESSMRVLGKDRV